MPLFRKKPVVIEAHRFTGSTSQKVALRHWIEGGEYAYGGISTADMTSFVIHTLEGDMMVRPGWWVIKGVQGEFYPCDPVIFAATYEPEEN